MPKTKSLLRLKLIIPILAISMSIAAAPLDSANLALGGDALPFADNLAASYIQDSGHGSDSIVITSLASAEKLAFKNNLDVANGRLEIKSRRAKRNEVRSNLFPQLSASASASDNLEIATSVIPPDYFKSFGALFGPSFSIPIPSSPVAVQMGVPYTADAGLQARLKIFDPALFVALKAAKSSQELSELDLAKIREAIAVQVASVYYGLLLSNRQIDFLQKQLSSYAELFRVASLRYEGGVAKKTDPDRIRVDQTNLETELQSFEKLRDEQLGDLAVLIGVPPDRRIALHDSLSPAPVTGDSITSVNYSNRPDWQALRKQEELQELDIRRQKAEYLPVFAAKANYSQDFYGETFDPGNKESWYSSSAVSLSLDLPIFDGFAKNARIEQSRIAFNKLRNRQTLLEQQIVKEIRDADNSLLYASDRLKSQDANCSLAQEVYREAEIEYQGGTASISDLLTAENSLLESQRQYMGALVDRLTAQISLKKAEGTLLRTFDKE